MHGCYRSLGFKPAATARRPSVNMGMFVLIPLLTMLLILTGLDNLQMHVC